MFAPLSTRCKWRIHCCQILTTRVIQTTIGAGAVLQAFTLHTSKYTYTHMHTRTHERTHAHKHIHTRWIHAEVLKQDTAASSPMQEVIEKHSAQRQNLNLCTAKNWLESKCMVGVKIYAEPEVIIMQPLWVFAHHALLADAAEISTLQANFTCMA